jgi:hypothetical protein
MKHKIIITVTILLAACGSPTLNTNVTPTSTSNPIETDVFTSDDKLGGAVIVYQKSGGFTGITEEWTIFPDGRIVSSDGVEYVLGEEKVTTLLYEIDNLGFFEISGPGQLLSDCRDCFTYRITVSSGGRTKSINYVDDQADPTDPIWETINLIESLVSDL